MRRGKEFMTKQNFKNKKPLKKFGLGSDAARWEAATRHFSGYSPRPHIGGMGSYDVKSAPTYNQSVEAQNVVSGTMRGLDTEIYRRITGQEEANRGKSLNTKEFNAATQRMSGYSPPTVMTSDLKSNIKDVTANLSKLNNKQTKSILSLLKTSEPKKQISARQIENAFNQNTVSSILNNSESVSEVKNKIVAGIAMADIIRSGAKNHEKK